MGWWGGGAGGGGGGGGKPEYLETNLPTTSLKLGMTF